METYNFRMIFWGSTEMTIKLLLKIQLITSYLSGACGANSATIPVLENRSHSFYPWTATKCIFKCIDIYSFSRGVNGDENSKK